MSLAKMSPTLLKKLKLPRVVPVQEPDHQIWDLFHDQDYVQDLNLDPDLDLDLDIVSTFVCGVNELNLNKWVASSLAKLDSMNWISISVD